MIVNNNGEAVDSNLLNQSPETLIQCFVKLTVSDGTVIKGRMKTMNVPKDPNRVYVGIKGFRLFRADSMNSESEFISKYPVSFEFDEVIFRKKPVDKAFVGDFVQINGNLFVIEGIKAVSDVDEYKVFNIASYDIESQGEYEFKDVPSDVFDYVLEQREEA